MVTPSLQPRKQSIATQRYAGVEAAEGQRESTRIADTVKATTSSSHPQVDVLVIGSIASDISCDYAPLDDLAKSVANISPVLHTSNPAMIASSAGGVGRNVATAAAYAGPKVSLFSVIADDIAGKSLQVDLAESGIDTSHFTVLSQAIGARTAQYVSVNDRNKDLVLAMGDFSIFARPEFDNAGYWSDILTSKLQPRWIVTDGNWSTPALLGILRAAKSANIFIAFEPVSTVKATRLFHAARSMDPSRLVDIATPNVYELAAMEQAARDNGLFEHEYWWNTINNFELSSTGSRDKFMRVLGSQLTDQGVPQQTIRLLPYVSNIVTKLGSQGSLLTVVLDKDDSRLSDSAHAPYVLSRNTGSGDIGGIYMRLFPPADVVPLNEIVSVNGVGDTMLGVMIAGLVRQQECGKKVKIDEVVPIAQQAAILTLKSKLSVSPEIKTHIRASLEPGTEP